MGVRNNMYGKIAIVVNIIAIFCYNQIENCNHCKIKRMNCKKSERSLYEKGRRIDKC